MRTLTTTHMTAHQFAQALDAARKGDEIVYAVGELGRSIDYTPKRSHPVNVLHSATQAAWYDGRVHLVQRKLGLYMFQYVAVKCDAKRRERPTWLDGYESRRGRRSKDRDDRRNGEEGPDRPAAAGMEVAV